MGMFKGTRLAAVAAMVAGLLGGAATAQAADPLKVGFVYVGPVGDLGWSYQHDVGRKALEAHFGDKIKTAYVEDVAEGADSERVIAQFGQQGYDLVFTTSFGFMNPTVKVAKKFPKTKFEHATGYKTADNLAIYDARFHEGRAVIGTIAGHMTKTNVIGYIGSFPIPEVVRGINAVTLAARKVNPNVQVKVIWVNSWYDPGKEREAAETLIAQGADIITQHTDSPAAVQVAEEKGVWAFGQASDMAKFGPKRVLTSIIDDWSGYYIARVQAVMDGTWKADTTWGGFKSGMVKLGPLNPAIPADVQKAAMDVKAGIEAGALNPYAGPIKDQDGKERVKAGAALTDKDLLSMDWYVEGVQGKLPK